MPGPCRTLWERDLIESELEHLMAAFEGTAKASFRRGMSTISLICNVQRTSAILERVFKASSGLTGAKQSGRRGKRGRRA